ncbi:MAG: type II toxin-antitoxin system HicA family toxin [Patescibacteria group bacterium]
MPKFPVYTSREVIRLLKQNAFVLDHVTGSHYVFYHPVTRRRVVVPFHTRDLPKGTLRVILYQAGINFTDL